MNEANNQPSSERTEPQWVEEWVLLDKVVRHPPFQVRNKLDKGAVKQYRDWTKAGSVPPAIKVGRVNGVLYLIDGHHRMEAGALTLREQACIPVGTYGTGVLALVADMNASQARWEAAKVNMGHGVALKPSEYRKVFRAFIAAKRHIKPNGDYMSLRELGGELRKGHTTVYGWIRKYCPAILAKMGGAEHGNFEGGTGRVVELTTLDEEHRHEASKAVQELVRHATALVSPRERWLLLKELEAAAEQLRIAGVQVPPPAYF